MPRGIIIGAIGGIAGMLVMDLVMVWMGEVCVPTAIRMPKKHSSAD